MASLADLGRGGKQEVARARARALRPRASVLLSRGGTRQGGRWWAGPASCGAGPDGALGGAAGKRQVSFALFIFFCLFYLIYFATVLNFKQIQTMPKTPLNNFIWLDGLFQKLIKYFRGI